MESRDAVGMTHHAMTRMMRWGRFEVCVEILAIAHLPACRDLCVCAGCPMVVVATNAEEASDVVEGEEVATREHCRKREVCAVAASLEDQEAGHALLLGWR